MRTNKSHNRSMASVNVDNLRNNNNMIMSAIKQDGEEIIEKHEKKKYLRLKVGMISGREFEFEVLREDKYLVEQALKHGDQHEFKEFGVNKDLPGVVVKLEFHEYYTWF